MGSSAVQKTESEEDLSQLTFEQRLERQVPRVRVFVAEYPKDLNGKQAAIRARFSAVSARQRASEMLTDPEIRWLIDEQIRRMTEEAELMTLEVLRELRVIVGSSVDNYKIDDEGNVSLKSGVPEEAMRAISSVKRRVTVRRDKDGSSTETTEVELKLWSKPEGTRQAGEYLKMFKGQLELPPGTIGGVLAIPVQMESAEWEHAAIRQQSNLSKIAAAQSVAYLPAETPKPPARVPETPLTTVML